VLEALPGVAVHVAHDVIDPGGVFIGGIQFDEVVQAAKIERSVALKGIDLVQALSVGDLEDLTFDLITVRGMAVAQEG
jgi:hypothetical protein